MTTATTDLTLVVTSFILDGLVMANHSLKLGSSWKLVSFRQHHRKDWGGVELYRCEAGGAETFLGYVSPFGSELPSAVFAEHCASRRRFE